MHLKRPIKHLLATSILAGSLMVSSIAMAAAADKVPAGAVKDEKGYYAEGRILLKGKVGLSDSKLLDKINKIGGKRASKIDSIDVHLVSVPPGLEKKLIAQLQADPSIEFAELDRIVEPSSVPNDPYFPSQWHHTNINSQAAWDIVQGQGITIAILDTGVNGAHEDLAASMVPGWSFYDNTSNTTDVEGHGTEVAGAAAGITNNALGVSGVAGGAKIMPLRIVDPVSGLAYYSTIASATTYAADNGARVANCSYSYLFNSATVISAGNYMRNKGGILVVSAGNFNTDENGLQSDSMVVVSATGSDNLRAGWSSFGQMVDVAAPGVGIYTTTMQGGYSAFNGTFYSAPITAGTIALMMSANNALGPAQIENILFSTAKDIGDPGFDIYYGKGLIDAAAAVTAAKNTVATDTTRPTTSIANPVAGSTVKGTVAVDVNASDNNQVTRVDLLVNGAPYATDTLAPFSFSWDTTTTNDGAATITSKAFDSAGNSATSSAINVSVRNTVDVTPPVAAITSPANGATISGNIAVRASATDNVAVTSMALLINGKQVATSTTGSISFTWNTRKVAAGTHTIVAKATDSSGNTTQTSISVKR